VAETEKTVVIIPVILKVAEVEVPVTVRIPIHVRHPVVTVVVSGMCGAPSFFTENNAGHSLYFILSLKYSLACRTDLFDFFIRDRSRP